jgi:hypothetical protein
MARIPNIIGSLRKAVKSLTITDGCIVTHDKAFIDTIELTPESELSKSTSERKFIIKFNGNGGQYQDLMREYAYDADQLKQTVIGFNYRGVGRSVGKDGVISHSASLGYNIKETEKENGINTRKKVYSSFFGHNKPRSELYTKDGNKTGQDLFEEFASRSFSA